MSQTLATQRLSLDRTGSSTPLNAWAFFGTVDNTIEALRLVRAAQLGIVPRVKQRLDAEERKKMVVSGAVFVFDVEEAAMKRWTDGKIWSTSRIDGNFLLYKEKNNGKGSRILFDRFEEWRPRTESRSTTRVSNSSGASSRRDTATPTKSFKPGGLLKKTITVKVNDIDHHLVAYYTQEDIDAGRFLKISSRLDIMNVDMSPNIFHFLGFRVPPKVVQGAGGHPSRFVCEPETIGQDADDTAQPSRLRMIRNPSGTPEHLQDRASRSRRSSDGTLWDPDCSALIQDTKDVGSHDAMNTPLFLREPGRPAEPISHQERGHVYRETKRRRATYSGEWWPSQHDPSSPVARYLAEFAAGPFPAQSQTQGFPNDLNMLLVDERDGRDKSELWNGETRNRQPASFAARPS